MKTITQIDNEYVAHTYKRFPVEIVSGKGSVLYGSDGKRYIDLGSGIGVTAFGIADDTWNNAVIEQLGKVQHTSNLYYTEPCARLAMMLCERTGMKRVFFSNSGAEANECAIKVARKYAFDKKGITEPVILTLVNSFHGRTHTTLAATGQEVFHKHFQPLTPGFVHLPVGDIDALTEAVKNHPVAGILIECVQGEGGVNKLPCDYVAAIKAICETEDILLMVDEVQTGNGRCGTLYAYMQYGITPDVVSTAKGLGGGLPIGATLLADKVKDTLGYSDHGSTFGGNPIAAAGACSIIKRLDEDFLAEVKQKSDYLFETFQNAKGIKAVSGMGLMIGLETEKPASEVLAACMEKGVLCLTAKTKLRLLPALNIPMDILKEAVSVILDACQ
ncbi:MAG: acetylornithine/succinylornithine family transaminase [Clostridia bacterium]|nr:acetylornithine/succinylornithine family transaminase [Clostridia bacterium]